ncbi:MULTISPECIES: hypothetical protein [Streptomyces]|uniref:hypothetical protein n=1 Tax=Streptomyces TaxID=1883 RepID=UPI00123AA2D8|nr:MULTISPECIES: hypothetical protein [Streptomyces]NEA05491.1 hypothetical protein [Streptomyces sp. SID10116]MYY81108.1 hypothetical protein [Streptomyces sp. SID335]MYZ12856.1 hypothetical protein [Streptomyces sp. SID337]NDZ92436.1 hypothetical protein [Streptomyces sp. SID10115]NEB48382.1 hypothetical protein [Streptomyces sp. SID339]
MTLGSEVMVNYPAHGLTYCRLWVWAMETTARHVLDLFCASVSTERRFEDWKRDPRRERVAPVVLAHRTRVLYRLTEDDVHDVCQRTEHALGQVRREVGESVPQIVDWHPKFAFTHTFHTCVERLGAVPTYQQFREFSLSSAEGLGMLGTPAKELIRDLVVRHGVEQRRAQAAMRWRIGNAYYGFLREVYTLVQLRRRGIDLRVHPLADALFRVDAWTGRRALSLRVGNRKFRQGSNAGRKTPAELLLADVVPPLRFDTIELAAATQFGQVHVPTAQVLDHAADRLNVL